MRFFETLLKHFSFRARNDILYPYDYAIKRKEIWITKF